jgi:hypothetical protein
MEKGNIDFQNIGKFLIFVSISIVIIILLYSFITNRINLDGFSEFIISSLLLIFLIEKINIKIKIPGFIEAEKGNKYPIDPPHEEKGDKIITINLNNISAGTFNEEKHNINNKKTNI